MIIVASQRSGARRLALHLLNVKDNEHIEVHSVRGFMSEDVLEALHEAAAVAQGTRCRQHLFSASLSPPQSKRVGTEVFEDALERIEKDLEIAGQPRIVVFHIKEGRRHAHCAWSRIDVENMRAINLPFFKNKLNNIAKELYLDYGWTLPSGFIDRAHRNPLNFTLAQWQQAKRIGEDARTIKRVLKECWAISDDKIAFDKALEQHGYYLARGDRRGYVAVDWRGEIYSLTRWLDIRTKVLRTRLGQPSELPSASQVREKLDQRLAGNLRKSIEDIDAKFKDRMAPLIAEKQRLKKVHTRERRMLTEKQTQRSALELEQRQERFATGIRGTWQRFSGKHAQIKRQNEREAYQALVRDQEQKDALIFDQLTQRQHLQKEIVTIRTEQGNELQEIKRKLFSGLPVEKTPAIETVFNQAISQKISREYDYSGSMQ